jgi:hypothetical protein
VDPEGVLCARARRGGKERKAEREEGGAKRKETQGEKLKDMRRDTEEGTVRQAGMQGESGFIAIVLQREEEEGRRGGNGWKVVPGQGQRGGRETGEKRMGARKEEEWGRK